MSYFGSMNHRCSKYFGKLEELKIKPFWMQELKRFPSLTAEIAAAANDALERFREDGRKTVLRLVEMESSYLTVEFFRKLPLEGEKGGNTAAPNMDRYADNHLRRIGNEIIMVIFF